MSVSEDSGHKIHGYSPKESTVLQNQILLITLILNETAQYYEQPQPVTIDFKDILYRVFIHVFWKAGGGGRGSFN